MGGTKQSQVHLRRAWLAIPQAPQVEKFQPMLDHQTQSIIINIFTEAKGLSQELLITAQGTRVDWRSQASFASLDKKKSYSS